MTGAGGAGNAARRGLSGGDGKDSPTRGAEYFARLRWLKAGGRQGCLPYTNLVAIAVQPSSAATPSFAIEKATWGRPLPAGGGRGICIALFLSLTLQAAAPKVPITALTFTPDGKTLLSGGYKEVIAWNPLDGKLSRKYPGLTGQVRAIATGVNQAAIATGIPGRAGAVELLDLATGIITPIEQAKDEILAVALSPDGRYLATGGTDAIVRIHDLIGKTSQDLKGHTDWVTGLAFSTDGKLLASSSADRTARVWKTETWKEEFQLPLQITEPISAVAFAPEGDLLAFTTGGPEEHAVRTWRTQGAFTEIDASRPGARNQVMQTRAIDTGACMPLAIAWLKAPQHSRMLVACTDKTIRVIGANGNTFATLTGHADWVYAVAALSDGSRLASGSGDGAIKIWNAAGKLLFTLEDLP